MVAVPLVRIGGGWGELTGKKSLNNSIAFKSTIILCYFMII